MTVESQAARDARMDMTAVLGAVVVRLPRIILVTMLLLAAAFAFLMFQPRMYESSAGILVEPRSNIYTRAANEQAPPMSAADASVVSSQIELIKSRDTLLEVIDELDLRSVPEFNGAGASPSPLADAVADAGAQARGGQCRRNRAGQSARPHDRHPGARLAHHFGAGALDQSRAWPPLSPMPWPTPMSRAAPACRCPIPPRPRAGWATRSTSCASR